MLEAKFNLRDLVIRKNSANKLVSFNIGSSAQPIKPGQSMYVSDRHVFTPFPSLERPANSQSLYHLFIPKPAYSTFKQSSRHSQGRITRSFHRKHRSDLINDSNPADISIHKNSNQQPSDQQLQSSGLKSILKRGGQSNSARHSVHRQQSKQMSFSKSKRNVCDFQSQDKIKEKKQMIPRKKPKQRKKIVVNKQQQNEKNNGCFALKMTTIPFNISKRDYREYIGRGSAKDKQEANQPIKEESLKQDVNNEEEMKKMILTREEQLRNKLMRQILAGSKMGAGNQKHFISYFPHTDYELALKQYLNRQQAKQQKGKFCSETFLRMSEEIKEEEIKIALKRAVRRESCFVFTQFNRKKYELSITREELIDRVIKAKTSQEITGVLLDRIEEKIVNLGHKKRSTEYDYCHDGYFNERNLLEVQQLEENRKFEDLSIKCIGSQQYQENNRTENVRISMIAPVDFNRNESDKKIFTELIASMGNNVNKSQSSLSQNSVQRIKTQKMEDKSVKNRLSSQRLDSKLKEKEKKQKRFNTLRPEVKKLATSQNRTNKKSTDIIQTSKSNIAKNDKIFPKINENKKIIVDKSRQIIKDDGTKLKKIKTIEISKIIREQEEKMQIKNVKIQEATIKKLDKVMEDTPQRLFNAFQTIQNLVLLAKKDFNLDPIRLNQLTKEIILSSEYLFLSIFPIAKFHQAFTILSLIAEQYLLKLIDDKKLYIFGQWVTPVLKLPHLDGLISNISALCLSLCKLAELQLLTSLSELTLEQILKMLTGHRIIWFRNKSTTEREVTYHHSKGHHIVFVSKKNENLGVLEKIEETSQGKLYKIKQIDQQHSIYLDFRQIMEEMDIVSINKRINCLNHNWGYLNSQIEQGKDQILSISAPTTTKGTVTIYFPQMQGKVVELILQKIGSQNIPGEQQIVKQIGKVEEKLRYDNIYFEFSIHGTYRLKLRVKGIFVENCRIAYQTTQQISMKASQ